jgi:hypothetical protein
VALYNYLRVQFSYHSPNWQIQLEPLSSWEVGAYVGQAVVIDPAQPAGALGSAVRVSYNGYVITSANYSNEFAIKSLDATEDIGYGWTAGTTMLDPYARLAEKFCYDEIETTADSGPEHEISYVNIFTANTEQADYDDLACLGLNILASTEATELAQASQSVTNGYEMRRLMELDSIGPTHMWPDVLRELLTSSSLGEGAYINDQQIDVTSFIQAAQWCYARRYFFDAVMPEPVNILEWAGDIGATHLLKFTKKGSLYGLQPALLFGTPLPIEGLFTAGNIVDGSFELDMIPYDERQPVAVIVKYRQESLAISGYQPGLFPVERTVFVKETGRPDTDPIETLDMSDYCTSMRHAVDAAAFLIRTRRLVDHVIRFSTTPEGITASLASGDYINVAYNMTRFDAYAHGVITNEGVLVTTRPDLMTPGPHACLTWDGSTSNPIDLQVTVNADGTATPTGIMFAQRAVDSLMRVYEITRISLDQSGIVQIEASYHPTDEPRFSLIAKNWPTYATDQFWTLRV